MKITKDIVGLHATCPVSSFLSLFCRKANFTRDDLDRILYQKKQLGKIRFVRKTVHILPQDFIPTAFVATGKLIEQARKGYDKQLGISKEYYHQQSQTILKLLQDRSLTTRQIKEQLGPVKQLSFIVNMMCDSCRLIRGAPATGWKSNTHIYHRFDNYFPDLSLSSVNESEAITELLLRYLKAFGPVTLNDITWWTGLTKTKIQPALNQLQKRIMTIEIKELPDEHLMLKSDHARMKKANLSSKPTVKLLPLLDPYLMGYKDRNRYLSPENYDKIFDKTGNAANTILLNGRVIGVWDLDDQKEPTIKLHLFEKTPKNIQKMIATQAQKTGQFLTNQSVKIKTCNSMTPLPQRTAGSFMTPLKNC